MYNTYLRLVKMLRNVFVRWRTWSRWNSLQTFFSFFLFWFTGKLHVFHLQSRQHENVLDVYWLITCAPWLITQKHLLGKRWIYIILIINCHSFYGKIVCIKQLDFITTSLVSAWFRTVQRHHESSEWTSDCTLTSECSARDDADGVTSLFHNLIRKVCTRRLKFTNTRPSTVWLHLTSSDSLQTGCWLT